MTKNDSKKLWNTFNEMLGKKANSAPSLIQSDGSFITKPNDIANLMIFKKLARLGNLGITCQQQLLTLHIQVYRTKLCKTSIVILNSVK
jgi:hypothetical protein